MAATKTSADSFVHDFAKSLLQRADLQLDENSEQRYVEELERAIHQRLGVAAFEQLGEQHIQDVVKDFLHGASSEELVHSLKTHTNPPADFVEQELQAFSAEFLEAVRAK